MYLVVEEDNHGRPTISVFHSKENGKALFDSIETSWATPVVSMVQIEGGERLILRENGDVEGAKLLEKKEENILI